MSLNDGSKEVENGESLIYFAAWTGRGALCRLGVCRVCVMCRNLLPARLCYGNVAVHNVLTNCLLPLMSTIFLILTAINSIL